MTKAKEETKAQAEFADFSKFGEDVAGYEGLDMSTMAIPFIRIIQALSPQLKKNKPEFIAGAECGDVCNSITGKTYKLPLKVVVGKFERLFIEWKPMRGGYVAAHNPETIENNPKYTMNEKYQLVDPDTKNEFIDTYMYYVVLPDYMEDGICVMSMSSTQLKEARKLNRLLMTTYIPGTTKKALPHFMVWDFTSLEMSNDKGDWYTPSFKFDTFVSQAQLDHVVDERKALPDKRVDFAQLDETAGKTDEAQPVGDVKY
jgi:hypothetical protein